MSVATYDLQVGVIRRSCGHTAVREAAYITGQRLVNAHTGQTHDFRWKRGVLGHEIIGPAHLDAEWFANSLEARENRCNSVTARTVQVALPEELSDRERWGALHGLGTYFWTHFSLGALVAEHAPPTDKWSSGRNHHGHLLLPTRAMDLAGCLLHKTRDWDVKETSQRLVRLLREAWANILNHALEHAGLTARVDHRSLRDRGSLLLARRYLPRAEYIACKLGRLPDSRYARENQIIDNYNRNQQLLTQLEGKLNHARDAIRQRAARTIERAKRTVAAASRGIEQAKRTIAAASHGIARAKQTIAAASHGIARSVSAIRVAQHTVERHSRRERRGPAINRKFVDQTFQREADQLSDNRGNPYRRRVSGDEQPSSDRGDCLADAGIRPASQPSQRHAPGQGESPKAQPEGELDLSALVAHAAVNVDLPGFFYAQGWRVDPAHDTQKRRALIEHTTGRLVTVYRDPGTHCWHWVAAEGRQSGGIVEAVQMLLAVISPADIITQLLALLKQPPAAIPFPVVERALSPLGRRGRAYLAQTLSLNRETIAAFAGAVQEDVYGNVVALHDPAGAGEVGGADANGFVARDGRNGPSQERSLWYARPSSRQSTTLILVATTLRDALTAWQILGDPALQAQAVLVSTAGAITQTGVERLTKLVRQVRGAQNVRGHGDSVTLIDLTCIAEDEIIHQSDRLIALAESLEVQYLRSVPGEEATTWSEYLRSDAVGSDVSTKSEWSAGEPAGGKKILRAQDLLAGDDTALDPEAKQASRNVNGSLQANERVPPPQPPRRR